MYVGRHVKQTDSRSSPLMCVTKTSSSQSRTRAFPTNLQLHHDVRPDSVLILRAAQECIAKPDFDSMLNQARDRVDEIEGTSQVCSPRCPSVRVVASEVPVSCGVVTRKARRRP